MIIVMNVPENVPEKDHNFTIQQICKKQTLTPAYNQRLKSVTISIAGVKICAKNLNSDVYCTFPASEN